MTKKDMALNIAKNYWMIDEKVKTCRNFKKRYEENTEEYNFWNQEYQFHLGRRIATVEMVETFGINEKTWNEAYWTAYNQIKYGE